MIQEINKTWGTSKRWQTSLILVLFAIFTGGLNYVGWPEKTATFPRVLSILLLIYFVTKIRLTKLQNFRYFILALAFMPFISVIYSYQEYGQPVYDGIKGTLPSLIWLLYFVLHCFKVESGSFFKAVFCVAVLIAFIQIIQQFTYPDVLFGITRDEESLNPVEELAENRNGFWRFRFGDTGYFAAMMLFLLWSAWLKKMKMNLELVITFLLMFVSIYLTLTRQIIFSVLLTLFISYFTDRKSIKVWMFVFGIFAVGLLYSYSDILFAEFVEQTDSEINNDNYIRILAATYFWNETFSSVSAAFLGHGIPVSGNFLQLHQELMEYYRFFVSDVGFIGMMWRHGVIYVMVCYALLINLLWQKRRQVPGFIRLFTLFTIIPSIMIFPMANILQRIIWCFLLYYCDLTINYNKTHEKEACINSQL